MIFDGDNVIVNGEPVEVNEVEALHLLLCDSVITTSEDNFKR